jgi:hypothetical protein
MSPKKLMAKIKGHGFPVMLVECKDVAVKILALNWFDVNAQQPKLLYNIQQYLSPGTAKVIGLALITSIYDFLLNYILILAIYNKTWP